MLGSILKTLRTFQKKYRQKTNALKPHGIRLILIIKTLNTNSSLLPLVPGENLAENKLQQLLRKMIRH